MDIQKQLSTLVQSGVKIIEIVSYEWQRIHAAVNEISEETERPWLAWNCHSGLQQWDAENYRFDSVSQASSDDDWQDAGDASAKDPLEILQFFIDKDEPLILILEDFFHFMTESNYQIIRAVREINRISLDSEKTLILLNPYSHIPRELEKEMASLDWPLPNRDTLKTIFEDVVERYDLDNDPYDEDDESILEAALGLTVMEAEAAFAQAIVECGHLTRQEIPLIVREKERIIRQSGQLEYFHPEDDLENIGGLENLKEWLQKRGYAFGKDAKEYGLDTPRGVLLLGVQGCGKSLSAKAIAKAWQFPLLRFDLGKVFGGIVGESEYNIRNALKIAQTIAPCVLWIDEIEKGFSGFQSSGRTDGGTTSRVLGTFLTWMQEKTEPVFVVATANDISQLPPELLRKGRLDEIFFVDLPGLESRKEILSIHIRKKEREPNDFDLGKLARESKGYSGAELEEAVKEAMFQAFSDGREFATDDISKAIETIVPLVATMPETIADLRKWAKARARLASEEVEDEKKVEQAGEDVPRLRQEIRNPFMAKGGGS